MTVFVDDAELPYGGMLMCHMIADSREELDQMADRIGVRRKWIQHPGDPRKEHYDICAAKRRLALRSGAVEISPAELVAKLAAKGKSIR